MGFVVSWLVSDWSWLVSHWSWLVDDWSWLVDDWSWLVDHGSWLVDDRGWLVDWGGLGSGVNPSGGGWSVGSGWGWDVWGRGRFVSWGWSWLVSLDESGSGGLGNVSTSEDDDVGMVLVDTVQDREAGGLVSGSKADGSEEEKDLEKGQEGWLKH